MLTLLENRRLSLYHAEHHLLARRLRERGELVDLLCLDAPYSERTHSGHNSTLPGGRSPIPYAFWTPEDVHVFVDTWRPVHKGWLVSITDHVLWDAWQRAAERAGYYADFPPVPLSITGSRVRMRGDGPSPISYFLLVARPAELSNWGTIGRGAYYGKREKLLMTGAKPLWAMREIIQDYSRHGQVVCDPVCGSGTTLAGALFEKRLAIGADGSFESLDLAEDRLTAITRYLDAPGIRGRRRVSTRVDEEEACE